MYLYANFWQMIVNKIVKIFVLMLFIASNVIAQDEGTQPQVITGAERIDAYMPLLEGKRVGLLINHTSIVGPDKTLLPDTLLSKGINVVKILAPEHGFRGTAEAGEQVKDGVDQKTGLPVVSLYGRTKKPTKEHLQDVDVIIYDIQDVGARFYTYISTMQYAMEACAAYGKPFIILDRPNPNGHYVDGPVLEEELKSFVGMQPIPVVYGMTAGEYAKMLVGEGWFSGADKLDLTVITCEGYDHSVRYSLPVNPSPNLRNMAAIYLYPSLCLFEGTDISVGRGTDYPFQQFGHPSFKGKAMYGFMPNIAEKGPDPLHAAKTCYGMMLALDVETAERVIKATFKTDFLRRAYYWYDDKDNFFNNFFDKLAGTKELKKQIQQRWSEADIRDSWQPELDNFKKTRKKYLLYKDFDS